MLSSRVWSSGASFDVLKLNGEELVGFCVDMIMKAIVQPGNLSIDVDELECFVACCRAKYNKLPFHNFFHAVSVTQCVISLMSGTDEFCAREQLMIALIALCHDAGHLGYSNSFLAKEFSQTEPTCSDKRDPVFLVHEYGTLSTLEKHHIVETLELFGQHKAILDACIGCEVDNFICSGKQLDELRNIILNSILSTDLVIHNTMLGEPLHDRARKLKIIGLILHAADLSNPCRDFEASLKWSNLLVEERRPELKENIELQKRSLNTGEIGFVNIFVLPAWKILHGIIRESTLSAWTKPIFENLEKWKSWRYQEVSDIAPLLMLVQSNYNESNSMEACCKHETSRRPLELTETRSFMKRMSANDWRAVIFDKNTL